MARYPKDEIERANKRLSEILQPGDTVFTSINHVSSSGMSRSISLYVFRLKDDPLNDRDIEPICLDYWASRLLGESIDQKKGGVKVSGVGMDMGFHLVYSLARQLWPDGWLCIGKAQRCPANDHLNEAGRQSPDYRHDRLHVDSGYALRHRWLR